MAAKRYLAMIAGLITEVAATIISVGAGDDGKIVALDATGKIDTSVLPVGVGPDTQAIATSESLVAGDVVNIFNSTGAKVRKADWSVSGKEGHGFVLTAFTHPTTATVYFEGTDTQVSGLTAGVQYGDPANPGRTTHTPPSTAGQVVQRVGMATAATALNFDSGTPVLLA
jgi:hypothetical protein